MSVFWVILNTHTHTHTAIKPRLTTHHSALGVLLALVTPVFCLAPLWLVKCGFMAELWPVADHRPELGVQDFLALMSPL